MGSVVTKGQNDKQILANAKLFQSFGAQIADTGVAVKDGKKVILAGTPVGGADFLADEQASLKVANDATAVGVLLHDVDVTSGQANGTVVVFGWVNLNRLDESVTIADEAKTALENKVTFVKRNK